MRELAAEAASSKPNARQASRRKLHSLEGTAMFSYLDSRSLNQSELPDTTLPRTLS